jgi:hypothetical protein
MNIQVYTLIGAAMCSVGKDVDEMSMALVRELARSKRVNIAEDGAKDLVSALIAKLAQTQSQMRPFDPEYWMLILGEMDSVDGRTWEARK